EPGPPPAGRAAYLSAGPGTGPHWPSRTPRRRSPARVTGASASGRRFRRRRGRGSAFRKVLEPAVALGDAGFRVQSVDIREVDAAGLLVKYSATSEIAAATAR